MRSLLLNRHDDRLIKVAEVLAEEIDSAAMHGGFLYAEFEAHGFAAGYSERIEIVSVINEHAVEERAGRGYLDLFQQSVLRASDGPVRGRKFTARAAEVAGRSESQ